MFGGFRQMWEKEVVKLFEILPWRFPGVAE
jgi:hypothetical protein